VGRDVEHIGEKEIKGFCKKPQEKELLERLKSRWEDNIKTDVMK
jgi:hypothetical protein